MYNMKENRINNIIYFLEINILGFDVFSIKFDDCLILIFR